MEGNHRLCISLKLRCVVVVCNGRLATGKLAVAERSGAISPISSCSSRLVGVVNKFTRESDTNPRMAPTTQDPAGNTETPDDQLEERRVEYLAKKWTIPREEARRLLEASIDVE